MACNLYDGVAYRTIRKAKRDGHFPADLDMLIVSAKYGIISPRTKIVRYEQRMTAERAGQLADQCPATLKAYLERGSYREVLLWMGRDYRAAIAPLAKWKPKGIKSRTARGRIGQKLRCLKGWLGG
jgi:hypothetical protein